ncbi:hypothetical protein Hanom_Chr09g00809441 [Helianthus anomalus]
MKGGMKWTITRELKKCVLNHPLHKLWDPRHNMCAFLNPHNQHAANYQGIITFLRRLKIFYAILHEHVAYKSHQRAFWDSATIEDENNEEVTKAKVEGHEVIVSKETTRMALQFGDKPEDSHTFPTRCYQGCLLKMKCT